MEAVVVEDRARVLVGAGGGRSKEAEHKDAQLKFVALGGMTMTGVIAWMKVAEQWRAWVFLILNLLLLAILFSSSKNGSGDSKHADKKEEATSTRMAMPATTPKCDASEVETECRAGSLKVSDNEEDWEQDVGTARRGCFEGDKEEEEEEDELNERAEAFIVMFRQHLLADAKKHRQSAATPTVHCLMGTT